MSLRLAVIASHPIQYQAPLFRRIAATSGVELEVLFLSDHGLKPTMDEGFGQVVRFDSPLLEGYAHRFLRNRSPRPGLYPPFGLLNPSLATAIGRGGFDAVCVQGYNFASHWIAYAAAAGVRVPWMMRGESTLLYETTPLRRAAKTALLAPLVRGAGALLCIGEHNRRFYESLGARPSQLFHAPYSVDNDYFATRARTARDSGASAAIRQRLGAGPDDVVLLFVGKYLKRKRPVDVVEAVASLGDASRRVVVAFVGEGEERPALESAIARTGVRACLTGFVNQSELGAWYGASDLFVLPSTYETWGLVVNEAMAAGLPVVVSDLVGCGQDLVAGRGTGGVHKAADPASLAEVLRPLVGDDGLRRSAAAKALEVIAGYDVSVTAAGVVEALQAVASRRSAA